MQFSPKRGRKISMQAGPIITIGGENLIDTVQTTASDGRVACTDNLGGSPYNVAIALARQGLRPHYLTPVSTDDFGQRLAENLTDEGVALAGARRPEPTTRAVVTLKDGVPSYVFHRDTTAERCVTAQGIIATMPQGATHFHAGSLAFAGGDDAEAWETAFHTAARQGMTTSLDPNVRASLIDNSRGYRARLMRLLASASIVKLSDEDLTWIYPGHSLQDASKALRAATGARLVALTKGPEGAECWSGDLHVAVRNPAFDTLSDTIGAGDTLRATILAYLVQHGLLSMRGLETLQSAHLQALVLRGVFAACLNCTKAGCNPPTAGAIDDALARGAI